MINSTPSVMMTKPCLLLLALLLIFPCTKIYARTFRYALLVHSVDEQVKVEVYTASESENKHGLSIDEAVEFLRHAPRSRGANRIGILVEGCPNSVCIPLLKTIIESPTEMELSYFGDFDSDRFKKEFESHQRATNR